MRPSRSAIVPIALLLSLAGCAGGEDSAGDEQVAPTLPPATAPTEATATDDPTDRVTPDAGPVDGTDEAVGTTEPDDADVGGGAVDDGDAGDDAVGAATPDLDAVSLGLRDVAGLDAPIAMATRTGDATLYVAERAGRVRPVTTDGDVGAPIVDISDSTTTGSERGLLGVAWSSAGDRLFLSSTDPDGATVLDAFDVVDGVLQPGSRTTLLRVPQPAGNHNGGNVLVGPDGHLWLGLGDGGGANDQFGQGQRPDTLLGAMLRISPTADGYEIPSDNPFADGQGGAPEVWAYGLRNPWRFSFDAATGDLWIADVGQNAVEEINRVPADAAGLNYGWPVVEGDRSFAPDAGEGPFVDPVHVYNHDRGCSITGGYVYRGRQIPALQGAYLYSDFCSGVIWAADITVDGTVRADIDTGLRVPNAVSFGEGPEGELYVMSLNGSLQAIVGN